MINFDDRNEGLHDSAPGVAVLEPIQQHLKLAFVEDDSEGRLIVCNTVRQFADERPIDADIARRRSGHQLELGRRQVGDVDLVLRLEQRGRLAGETARRGRKMSVTPRPATSTSRQTYATVWR